jgi:hypothetical protein
MRSSIFVFATDCLHEGLDAVLDNLQQRAGVDGVALTANYHDARDVFAHNPKFHVYRNEGDVAWFAPQVHRYASGLLPRQAKGAGGVDVFAQVCERAAARGLAVDAWTIFLHNSVLATQHPDCATHNVYGDPYLSDLCPANPRVRAYCCELAGDIARYPVRRLLAESLHYRPLEHGEHHERYLIPLPPEARMLMALCFCEHCRAAGGRAGVDVPGLIEVVRAALEPAWAGALAPGHAEPLLAAAWRPMLERYVEMRAGVVTGLVAQVHAVLAKTRVELSFIDHAGGMSHVMQGASADDDITLASRRLGIDPAAVAAVCDEYAVLGYVDTPQRLRTLLVRYRQLLGKHTRMSVALRPLLPDSWREDNLRDKVAVALAAQPSSMDFYHYAMMPLNRLDWIRDALANTESAS